MALACREIDFNRAVLLQEAGLIGVATKGAFTYEVMRNLPWDDYSELIENVPRVIEEAYRQADQRSRNAPD